MALHIENLSVQLGERRVLSELAFILPPGKLLTVIGPNGSGKSTLLRAISGLLKPQSGECRFDGELLPTDRAKRARIVAYLPQNPGGDGALALEAMTMLGRTPHLPPYGTPTKRDFEAVEAAIALASPDLRGRPIGELSGGERQRALMCRALATQAPVLLLDEPVSALDIKYQHEILALIQRLTRERQLATICVLHGINLAASIADIMLLLGRDGRSAAFGTPDEVMTAANLSTVYEVPLQISPHPLSGRPQAQSWWEF